MLSISHEDISSHSPNLRFQFDPVTNETVVQCFEQSSKSWISMDDPLWKRSLLNVSHPEQISRVILRAARVKPCVTGQAHDFEEQIDYSFYESFGRTWAYAVAVGCCDSEEEEDIDVVELSTRSYKRSQSIYQYGGQLTSNNRKFTSSFKKIFSSNLIAGDSDAVESEVADYYVSGVNDAKNADELKILAGHRMVSIGHLVYLFGGSSSHGDEFNNELWVYNTRTNTWSKPELKGEIPSPREGHSMTVVKLDYTDKESYRIYIIGGSAEDVNTGASLSRSDIHVLNPYTMEFEEVIISPDDYEDDEVILPPTHHHSAVFHKGMIYVLGGYNGGRVDDEYIYIFDIDTKRWKKPVYISDDYLPHGIVEHTATVVGDFMLVFGGKDRVNTQRDSSVYVYSFESSVWSQADCTGLQSFDRSGHTTVHVGDGRLLVMGGGVQLHSGNDFVIIETGIREKSDLSHIFKKALSGLAVANILTDCEIIST